MATVTLEPATSRQSHVYRDARRVLTSILAPIERRSLIWLARRMPARVTSDHLTALALASMIGAGGGYWLARVTPAGLWVAILCLALNWFGDSLDGTLARVRGHERPRYGFYVDHVVDAVGAWALVGGLALSGYMSPIVALVLLATYLLLCVEIFLATHCVGTFTLSYLGTGPTELRLLLALGTAALARHPVAHLAGHSIRLFDLAGTAGAVGLFVVFALSAARHTRILYLAEPIPHTQPFRGRIV